MTVAYSPRSEWTTTPQQPELSEGVVDGDLCDISMRTRTGRKHYCHETAVTVAVDVDGRVRILCAEHKALYFPGAV